MTREINPAGIQLVKDFEGFRSDAYICPAGVLTIGYGHTGHDVGESQCISEARAEELLRADMESACASVERLVSVSLSGNQFAALASFAFNCGAGNLGVSTLLKKLNRGDYDAVPTELGRWVKATDPATGKKRTLAGLVRRRAAEGELWLCADGAAPEASNEAMPQRIEPPVEPDRYRIIARGGLRLRGGPGLEFDASTSLPQDAELTVTQHSGDWAEVDCDGDGFVDGWVFASYLQRIG
ncbi:MAG: lysozyme [Gammaproteobacteria bacterium]|nr:lysozyme [Gammaproteobacteria bacterium]MBQ0838937.1 lysozyme [Gammaproteobacteria bacterium]